ncbi:carboxymuconolactone decarboxylase family protein [Pedobacter lithocola]|uniref:Carboxymuconolactone decarboxylase family protein n=1 Tax=Pedobacter lithocola TaxID=1908239 RepID=A0ABV8PH34_9SPHI
MNEAFPESYKLLREIDTLIKKTGIPPLYLELIKLRASQLNGCAYCLNIHSNDAIKYGEDPKRIYVLSAWREAKEWFTEEEQVILQLTEEITQIRNHGISDEVYNKSIELFGEQKTAYLITAAININSWNRLGVGLNMHPVNNKS